MGYIRRFHSIKLNLFNPKIMDQKKENILKALLNIIDESKLETISEIFARNFSKFNLMGLEILLDKTKTFDGATKRAYLGFMGELFEDKKAQGITEFEYKSIVCKNCKCGLSGYIFIDRTNKVYYTFLVETDDNKVIDLKECYSFDSNAELEGFKHENVRVFPVF
jgi:hypothetical protein